MDQLDLAIHDTAHRSGIDTKDLARSIGVGHQIFINKCNPDCETNKLTLREGFAMMLHTKKVGILRVQAQALGYKVVKIDGEPLDLLEAILEVGSHQGNVHGLLKAAMEDGKITSREEAQLKKAIAEARDKLVQLERAISNHSVGELVDMSKRG